MTGQGPPRYRNAFTLIELLVVVAVVALLIGILVPVLGSARRSAWRVQSLSQMRQLEMGWAVYATDADGVCVPGQPGRHADESQNLYEVGNGLHYRPRWFALLGAKSGMFAYKNPSIHRADEHSKPVDNPALLCPVVPDWVSTRNFPYGYNYQFLGNTRFLGDSDGAGYVNYPVRITKIRHTSQTVMFASSMGTAAGKPAGLRTANRADGSRDPQLRAMGGHGYALDPPRLDSTSDFADTQNPGAEHRSAPDPRYGGRANVAFCDGHADSLTLQQLGYEVAPDGRVLIEGPSATNKFFTGSMENKLPPAAQ